MELRKDDYVIGALAIIMFASLFTFLGYVSSLPRTPGNITCAELKCKNVTGGPPLCLIGWNNQTTCYEPFNMTCSWIEKNDSLCRYINHPFGENKPFLNPQVNNCSLDTCPT